MKKTGLILSLSILLYCACSTTTEQTGIPGARIESMPANVTCTTTWIDSTGFVWIGTEDSGLYHFDGTNYLHYTDSGEDGSLSSSRINRVFCDSHNNLWVGTDQGVDRYIPEEKSFRKIPIRGELKNVTSVTGGYTGTVLATTENSVYRYDEKSDSFKAVIENEDGSKIMKVYYGQNEELFLVGFFKIDRYDSDYNLIESYPAHSASVEAWKATSDLILLKSFPRLMTFDMKDCTFKPLSGALAGMDNPDKLAFVSPLENDSMAFAYGDRYYFYNFSTDTLISENDADFPFDTDVSASGALFVRKDKAGDYWIMTRTKGIAKAKSAVNPRYFPLERYAAEHQIKSIVSGQGKVWMLSDAHYLVTFDTETGNLEVEEIGQIVGRILGEERFCDVFWDEVSKRLFITVDSNVWDFTIDSEGERHLNRFYHPTYVSGYLRIAVDKNGGIWGGGRSGTLQYSQPENPAFSITFSDVNLNGLAPQTTLTSIICLDNGLIAAAFSNSAIGFIDPQTRQNRVVYMSSTGKPENIMALCQDNEGRLWIGTAADGLFFLDLQTYEITQSQALKKGKISNILRDDKGRMFIVSGSTLYQYIPSSGTFRTLLVSSGVSTTALCTLADNEMLAFLGGELNVLARDARTSVSRIPAVESVIVSNEKDEVRDIINLNGEGRHMISVGKTENNLKLAISTSELIDQSYLNCRVMFKGVFREWRDYQGTTFSLDNIPYGRHRLSFMLVNPAEVTSGPVYELTVVSRRPWHISTTAKICLLLIILCVAYFFRQLLRKFRESKHQAEMAEQEKEMQLRMNQQNIDFFTDISHEFRTPLTIISGSAETLLQDPQISSRQSHLAHLIQRNSDRMLKLVGQLMDLNKLDHGKLTLNVKACDVAGIVHNIYETFGNVAERKEISFTLDCPDYLLCWVDSDKFEKVIYNLLSNAFKYTPSGGSVALCAKVCNGQEAGGLFSGKSQMSGNYLLVSVTDTGIGIPDEKKAEIFTRFTRINPDSRTGGTGIGLSFSKSLVEAHHGMIGMRDGKAEDGSSRGSEFFFALPADNSTYSQAELAKAEPANQNTVDGSKYKSEYTIHPASAIGNGTRTKVLVIDDDSEILYYLALVLSPEYEVITRSDAMSGYKKMEEIHPDVIISDIMMVEMDGLKLCRMVKDDISLSHIPFILLTAKTTTEDQIEGMNAGADAYIVKPFDPNYLKAVITSLLRNRDNVRKALGASTSIEKVEVEEEAISQQDKKLLEKLYAIMEEHLMESELNISEMTVNLGMSRTKLYYKIKGLTGQTPNEFFKTFKLNKAAEMIKEGKYKISAISDMVGFSSPSHFAAAFQKQFGKLPSKY